MKSAVLFGFVTMIAWGFWIILGNVASNAIDPEVAAFVSYLAATVVTGVYVAVSDASFAVTNRALLFATGSGIAAATGVVATFVGVSIGSTAVVSTIGGMYFVTAALLSAVIYGESLSLNKVAGICLAVAAIVVINQ